MMSYNRDHPVTVLPPPRLAAAASQLPPTTAWMENDVLHFKTGGQDTAAPIQRTAPLVLEYVLYSLTQTMDARSVPFPIRRLFTGEPLTAKGNEFPGAPGAGGGPVGQPPQPPPGAPQR